MATLRGKFLLANYVFRSCDGCFAPRSIVEFLCCCSTRGSVYLPQPHTQPTDRFGGRLVVQLLVPSAFPKLAVDGFSIAPYEFCCRRASLAHALLRRAGRTSRPSRHRVYQSGPSRRPMEPAFGRPQRWAERARGCLPERGERLAEQRHAATCTRRAAGDR